MKKISNLLLAFLCSLSLFSQNVEMADSMRENGKIYVVVGVLLIILIGLIIYLISIDKSVRKLEKNLKDKMP